MKTVKFYNLKKLNNDNNGNIHYWSPGNFKIDHSGEYVKAATAQKIQELADSRLYLLSQIKYQIDQGHGLDVGDDIYKLIEKVFDNSK